MTWVCGYCKKPWSGNGGSISKQNECILCYNGPCSENNLVNGVVYHTECYQALISKIDGHKNNIQKSNNLRAELDESIRKADSILSKFSKLLGGKAVNKDQLLRKVHEVDLEIESSEKQLKYDTAELEYLYDYWPTYPPDWESRTNRVISRDVNCSECGYRRRLHVHHIIRIGNGGNHLTSNLILLCSSCHSKKHLGKDFSGNFQTGNTSPSSYSKRLALIKEAIANERAIKFNYTKYEGEKSKRTIKPSELEQVGKSLCVRGWCFLRNDKRIFSIKRMRNVRYDSKYE